MDSALITEGAFIRINMLHVFIYIIVQVQWEFPQ